MSKYNRYNSKPAPDLKAWNYRFTLDIQVMDRNQCPTPKEVEQAILKIGNITECNVQPNPSEPVVVPLWYE